MIHHRRGHACVVVDMGGSGVEAVVAGGMYESTARTTEIFNFNSMSWRSIRRKNPKISLKNQNYL